MQKYLDKINNPADLKKLSKEEIPVLCSEIRELLINSVSKSGGHLAGNLGVVELTIALHRVLNTPKDKIIWDVGHQSYVHKILTGRKNEFDTLRKMDGLSGFCSPQESEYDTTFTGHASSSLSVAAGIAAARDVSGEDYTVAAVIGDGAFTGGLAFEALNNIGHSKSKILIILNDNEMSIAENVGAFSAFLSRARTNPRYTASKRKIVEKIKNMPGGGKKLMQSLQNIKRHIKWMVTPNLLFEQFGVTYLGPVNGHSVEDMEDLLRRAMTLDEPVLIHVITKKGKGYSPAEKSPQVFHGVGPFEKSTGEFEKKKASFSDAFGKTLCTLCEKNDKIVAITPAMIPGSGLLEFSKKFPERLYDVGIAEGHAVTFAGGLARGGLIPVTAIYSSFLQRAYDNLICDVALANYHAIFAVDRAGLVAGDGATHQGMFDISYLTSIPNISLLSPSCYSELEKMLCYAVNQHNGPIAIRYPRGREKADIDNGDFILGRASIVREGTDVTIAAEGQSVYTALCVAEILKDKGISAEIIDVRTIKPIDFDTVFKSSRKTGYLYTLEENLRRGGMGEMLSSYAKESVETFKVKIKAIEDTFIPHGTINELNEKYGFTAEKIALDIERMLSK